MSFLSVLYTLIISPLELLFEVIFTIANRIIGNEGLSIIFLSLAVQFLVLPLYKRADELQAEERDIQVKMAKWVKNIKSTFKGDERFMMLQEYYRINHYKPIYALKSSASLLLQIPFFIAAYNLLSGMQSLQGMSFGFISDLGKEDAMFLIGSFPINVLPITMTLINIISGIIYTKGHPLKAKIQIYGLAAVFLVLLYHSPAGLVFYWLLNNVFSLAKNIFYKLKNPKKVLSIILAIAGALILVLTVIRPDLDSRQKILLSIGCVLLALPLITFVIKPKIKAKPNTSKKDTFTFVAGTVFMALLTGFFIPSSVINASPEEFINAFNPSNPLIYVAYSVLLSFGSWVLWGGIFYFFMSEKIKYVFSKGIWMICGLSVFNYMLFGTNLGVLSSTLQYEIAPAFEIEDYIINTFAVLVVASIFYLIYAKFQKSIKFVISIGILAIFGMGIMYLAYISAIYINYFTYNSSSITTETPSISLSANGQNVVIIMIDRAIGPLVPYIFNEKPELKEKFDGFTYYPNTISYGAYTNVGTPVLYGGYDYTPEKINARSSESLVSKQNEALKVMPVIFSENGYNVTIFDPTYANYQQTPDLSIYDDYPDFNVYNSMGVFNYFDDDIDSTSINASARIEEIRHRDFYCFALMKISPLLLQATIYDDGIYNEAASISDGENGNINTPSVPQRLYNASQSTGYTLVFLESYAVLNNLPNITKINDSSENTFFMMSNNITHSQCLLQKPDYIPALIVDNTAYDVDLADIYTIDGITLPLDEPKQIIHYHANMAAYLKLGEWFDYLREMGVYDNTRIVVVSDHGRELNQFDVICNGFDMQNFMPVLFVKDFNATGFTVSEEFMTNGDTPTLATSGLIEDPVNPFTHNPINSDAKNGPQTVFYTRIWNPADNNGNTFLPGSWYSFNGENPHDSNSWTYLGDY